MCSCMRTNLILGCSIINLESLSNHYPEVVLVRHNLACITEMVSLLLRILNSGKGALHPDIIERLTFPSCRDS